MRFWLTKNSELPVREQLIRQLTLGVLSGDLPPGQKLPSVRALARRHRIHANTVSAAYHDLLERGWLELRRGSGLYVRPPAVEGQHIDAMLAALLKSAREHGHQPEEVLRRLERLVHPRMYERVLVADPEPELRAILMAEIAGQVSVPVAEFSDRAPREGAVVAGLAGRVSAGGLTLALRLRSVGASLEGQVRPGPNDVVSVVSRSQAVRQAARAMLIAVGLDHESLAEVDAGAAGWQDRLKLSRMVITDVVAARDLPEGCPARVFRVISDVSIEELDQLCRNQGTGPVR